MPALFLLPLVLGAVDAVAIALGWTFCGRPNWLHGLLLARQSYDSLIDLAGEYDRKFWHGKYAPFSSAKQRGLEKKKNSL